MRLVGPPRLRGRRWWTWQAAGRCAAAGERAVPVPGDHRPAQVTGDLLGGLAHVQRQAGGARGAGQQAGAQERGQPGRAGQQSAACRRISRRARAPAGGTGPDGDSPAAATAGLADGGWPRRRLAGAGLAAQRGGEPVQDGGSTCPETTGTMLASQSLPGPAAGPRAAHAASASLAPSRPRS